MADRITYQFLVIASPNSDATWFSEPHEETRTSSDPTGQTWPSIISKWAPIADLTHLHGLNIQRRKTITTPVLFDYELKEQYLELGKALEELSSSDEDDDWRIDPPVERAAAYAASALKEYGYPVPALLTHGPKSVVFNWNRGSTNFYLTISANSASVLISTPKQIERRVELPIHAIENSSRLLPILDYNYSGITHSSSKTSREIEFTTE